jgi:hypothetical protein
VLSLSLGASPSAQEIAAVHISPDIVARDLGTLPGIDGTSYPPLVNRFQFDEGFLFKGETRGTHGVVYRLARATRVGDQVIQLGFDPEGKPKIARLLMEVSHIGTINKLAVGEAMTMIVGVLRPKWIGADTVIKQTLTHAFNDYDPGNADAGYTIATDGVKDNAALRLYPTRGKITFDIRPKVPAYRILDRDAAVRLLQDSTARLTPEGDDPVYTAYHAPDRLLAGQTTDGQSGEEQPPDTGSWRVAQNGTYCVERAPVAGWKCSLIVVDETGAHALMATQDGHPTGRITAAMEMTSGNPDGLFVHRVPDILPPDMVLQLSVEHTEERRRAGTENTVTAYFRANGTFKEGPEEGRWHVLQDGRRCWKVDEPDPGDWRCAYLRETDGGTFAYLNNSGEILAEGLIVEGNPRNW